MKIDVWETKHVIINIMCHSTEYVRASLHTSLNKLLLWHWKIEIAIEKHCAINIQTKASVTYELMKYFWQICSFYIKLHFPFSIHGLFFLSGAWIRGSVFSFSSIYSFILKHKEVRLSYSNRLWFKCLLHCIVWLTMTFESRIKVIQLCMDVKQEIYGKGFSIYTNVLLYR